MDRSDLISEAERRLWDAFPRGEVVDLGGGDPTAEGFDPNAWGDDRRVRGEVITRLLLGAREREPGYVARIALIGARVIGPIDLSGGHTEHELTLDRCWIDQPVNLINSSSSTVLISRSRLPRLVGFGWRVSGSVSLIGSRCVDEVRLAGAHITGQLVLAGATLTNAGAPALTADGLTVGGGMFCDDGFAANGEIRLAGASITGPLVFTGAVLAHPDETALNGDGLTVNGDAFLNDGFTAVGEIRLGGAHITGQLVLTNATLSNPDRRTLFAERLTVDSGMLCRSGFTSVGEIRLLSARVAGQLSFAGATLANPDKAALAAHGLTVDGDVFCYDGFTAVGEIRLGGAHITGCLDFRGAALHNPGRLTLSLASLDCPYVLLPTQVDGECDLRRAQIGTLCLPPRDRQPPMRLAGLTYTDLDPDPEPPVRHRVAWLRRDPDGFHPQPYEQLAAYYRGIGHDRAARRVLLAKHRTRRRLLPDMWRLPRVLRPLRPVLAGALWIPGWLYDALSGYGYVPWRALLWFVAATTTGAFALRDAASTTTPTENAAVNALLLALDATLPTHPLGIREDVDLTGLNYGIAFGLQVVGYALALAVIPTLTRALNRANPAN